MRHLYVIENVSFFLFKTQLSFLICFVPFRNQFKTLRYQRENFVPICIGNRRLHRGRITQSIFNVQNVVKSFFSIKEIHLNMFTKC